MRWSVAHHERPSASGSGGSDLGFRHLDYVELVLDHGRVHAQAVGVLHRLAQGVPIPLSVATRLVESGVPVVVHDDTHHNPGPNAPLRGDAVPAGTLET